MGLEKTIIKIFTINNCYLKGFCPLFKIYKIPFLLCRVILKFTDRWTISDHKDHLNLQVFNDI